MNELALFAGAGGGILGGVLLGWRTVAAVEIEAYPRAILLQRQADGILPRFPVWDDICTFDGRPWRGRVDVISGGFPCQDISAAGKGAGINGSRSGLWSEMARVVREVRPRFVFVENSPMLVGRGLGTVLGDLAAMGFDAEWGVLGADSIGGLHRRHRLWILAYATTSRLQRHINGVTVHSEVTAIQDLVETLRPCINNIPEPFGLRRLVDVPYGVDRLKALGNAQVPAVAALAWTILSARIGLNNTEASE